MADAFFPEPYENVPVDQLLLDKQVSKHGWMYKKAGKAKIKFSALSNYDKRYVVLLKGWVYYYKDRNSLVPQNYFSLKGYSTRVVPAEEEKNSALPWVFKLYTKAEGGRTWYFAPASKLRMSRSLPEKYSPKTPHGRDPGAWSGESEWRPKSFNAPYNRHQNHGSRESSASTSTPESIHSSSGDDLDYEPAVLSAEEYYEAVKHDGATSPLHHGSETTGLDFPLISPPVPPKSPKFFEDQSKQDVTFFQVVIHSSDLPTMGDDAPWHSATARHPNTGLTPSYLHEKPLPPTPEENYVDCDENSGWSAKLQCSFDVNRANNVTNIPVRHTPETRRPNPSQFSVPKWTTKNGDCKPMPPTGIVGSPNPKTMSKPVHPLTLRSKTESCLGKPLTPPKPQRTNTDIANLPTGQSDDTFQRSTGGLSTPGKLGANSALHKVTNAIASKNFDSNKPQTAATALVSSEHRSYPTDLKPPLPLKPVGRSAVAVGNRNEQYVSKSPSSVLTKAKMFEPGPR